MKFGANFHEISVPEWAARRCLPYPADVHRLSSFAEQTMSTTTISSTSSSGGPLRPARVPLRYRANPAPMPRIPSSNESSTTS